MYTAHTHRFYMHIRNKIYVASYSQDQLTLLDWSCSQCTDSQLQANLIHWLYWKSLHDSPKVEKKCLYIISQVSILVTFKALIRNGTNKSVNVSCQLTNLSILFRGLAATQYFFHAWPSTQYFFHTWPATQIFFQSWPANQNFFATKSANQNFFGKKGGPPPKSNGPRLTCSWNDVHMCVFRKHRFSNLGAQETKKSV